MTDLEEDILAKRIQQLERELESLRSQQHPKHKEPGKANAGPRNQLPLELEEYIRYGRQMIIPQIGLPGQLSLKKSSVLVIGAGGLGCPVLLYLVAAGIGGSNSLFLNIARENRHCGSRPSRTLKPTQTSLASNIYCWRTKDAVR